MCQLHHLPVHLYYSCLTATVYWPRVFVLSRPSGSRPPWMVVAPRSRIADASIATAVPDFCYYYHHYHFNYNSNWYCTFYYFIEIVNMFLLICSVHVTSIARLSVLGEGSLLCGSSWGFFHLLSLLKGFFWGKFFLPRTDGLRTEGAAHCTDQKPREADCNFWPTICALLLRVTQSNLNMQIWYTYF